MSLNYDAIAQKHNMTPDVVHHLAQAIAQGNGTQAQFSHPELGGSGQWMPGMIMIGDMFNNVLKARVSILCDELASAYHNGQIPSSSFTMPAMQTQWWTANLKNPSIVGGQNNLHYAYFPDEHRLVILYDGQETLYNTAPHTISGVSQQQSGTIKMLVFQTHSGQMLTVNDFSVVHR